MFLEVYRTSVCVCVCHPHRNYVLLFNIRSCGSGEWCRGN